MHSFTDQASDKEDKINKTGCNKLVSITKLINPTESFIVYLSLDIL